MKFTELLRSLKQRILPEKSGKRLREISSKIDASFTRKETSAHIENVRTQFNQLVELRDIFTRERDIDTVSRIHPALAVNLAASLQKNFYTDFFQKTKSLIIDIGNFPQFSGGPAFGTDFVSFEIWACSESCTLKQRPQHIDAYQPFINLVCLSSDVLSKPAGTLANEVLSPDMVLLAQVALRDTGWNEPASLAYMETSARLLVKQLRALIDVVMPEVFAPDHLRGA